MVHSNKQEGRKGKMGFEVLSKVDERNERLVLVLNIKNCSDVVHSLLLVKIEPNRAGISLIGDETV